MRIIKRPSESHVLHKPRLKFPWEGKNMKPDTNKRVRKSENKRARKSDPKIPRRSFAVVVFSFPGRPLLPACIHCCHSSHIQDVFVAKIIPYLPKFTSNRKRSFLNSDLNALPHLFEITFKQSLAALRSRFPSHFPKLRHCSNFS